MNRGLSRTLPAALILGLSAGVMAAEIHDAVRHGDAATVARLLKKTPKLANQPDEDHGATPLYHAVDAGNLEMVKTLLKAGAKVNATTAGGMTPMPEMVGILHQSGAKLSVTTDDAMTPMLRAAAIANPEGIAGWAKELPSILRHEPGAVPTASDKALQALPQFLVLGPGEEVSRMSILRLLVERGGRMSVTTVDTKCAPLHLAVVFPNINAVGCLLDHGADPEASALGMRPLHLAVMWGNAEVVQALIAHKADVNAVLGPSGYRPLHFAVFGGNVAIIRLLLDHGAEINAVDKTGAPALHLATWSDEIFNLLLERGADPKLRRTDGATTLHMACHYGSKELVGKLLQLHPDLEARDGVDYTPLLNAAEAGRVDLLKLLVDAGAYLDATENNGCNALLLAAGTASPEAARFLLDRRMDVNARSYSGQTALMNAAGQGRLETVALLLRAGANVNLADKIQGVTALMNAAFGTRKLPTAIPADDLPVRDPDLASAYLKITELLLAGGANLQVSSTLSFH